MATGCGMSVTAANSPKELDVGCGDSELHDQLGPTGGTRLLSSMGGQPLPLNPDSSGLPPPSTNGQYEIGAFYYIDPGELPPKSPIQLKEIRVVQVRERTILDVTVSFPSTCSLRRYFSGAIPIASVEEDKKMTIPHPELDERFVMSSNHAARILCCLVPSSELEEMHQERFWLVSPKDYNSVTVEEGEREGAEEPIVGSCFCALKSSPALCWGVRRKVKYIGKPKEMNSLPVAEEKVKEEHDESGRKRSRESDGRKSKGKKKKKFNLDNERSCRKDRKNFKQLKDRWSFDRYQSAELKLLNIMKEKGAVLGNPILRPELREEARKHIGDTGLLDHLLKHMAGKVVSDGTERFRRRHNPEGAMEYWLEAAELAELRKVAGVQDPCWVPLPGWKLGDPISPCGMECHKETNHLKEEIASLRREIECSLKQQEKEAIEVLSQTDGPPSGVLQERYENLLQWNNKLEEQVAAISGALEGIKEEMRVLKEENARKEHDANKEKRRKETREMGKEDKKKLVEAANCHGVGGGGEIIKKAKKDDDKINSTVISSGSNSNCTNNSRTIVRRSGFRLCKPQGTFLWPSMGVRAAGSGVGVVSGSGSCSGSVVSPPQGVVPSVVEDHLVFGVPTPPSASSAVSGPKLALLPSPTSPVPTRADVVVVSHAKYSHPPPHHQQRQFVMYERTGSSGNGFQPHVPPRVGSALASAAVPFGGGDGKKELWMKGADGGGGAVSTDLALASSSYCR